MLDPEWAPLRTTVQAADAGPPIMRPPLQDTKANLKDALVARIGRARPAGSPSHLQRPSRSLLDYYGDLSDAIEHWHHGLPHPLAQGRRLDTPQTPPQDGDFENVLHQVESPRRTGLTRKWLFRRPLHIRHTVKPRRCAKLGGHGFVQTSARPTPPHDLKVWELIQEKKWDEARRCTAV